MRELRPPNDPGLAPASLVIFDDLRDLSGSRFRALAAEISTDAGHQAAVLEEHTTWLINSFATSGHERAHMTGGFFRNENLKRDCNLLLDAFQRLSKEVALPEKEAAGF